ncbi:MAG: MBL fold metallo-hydrolase [Erysipelotrichaceae bacterium]|nr:MBL fold metallo-hydrolase [Erysipelotrichaceae bacterium]
MEIRRLVLGPLATNTYLLTEGDKALLIDPASKPERLLRELEGLELLGILLTHGHFDHIKAVDGLYDAFHCPVYLHPSDEEMARDKASGALFGLVSYIRCPIVPLEEKTYEIGPFCFETVFTPGHTEGSVLFLFGRSIFTGDTLFCHSVGRTDLPGGSESKLRDSLRYFRSLSGEYDLYPGHEQPTTLSHELMYNPFLR